MKSPIHTKGHLVVDGVHMHVVYHTARSADISLRWMMFHTNWLVHLAKKSARHHVNEKNALTSGDTQMKWELFITMGIVFAIFTNFENFHVTPLPYMRSPFKHVPCNFWAQTAEPHCPLIHKLRHA